MPEPDTHDPQPWRTLASTYLFQKKPWLTMRQDRVQLPAGGLIEEYYVWEYPAWVNVVALTADGRLVLIRQFRYALGQVHFELPAGTCDAGETDPLQAARRELREETGFGGGQWRPWMALSANPALQTNLTYTFLATGVEPLGPPRPEATEDLTVHLVPPERARQIVLGGEMVQALHVTPLLKFFLVGAQGA
jgi:8-oxo-dGTP pyrophosphatase MutT (NUDIX family)